MLCNKSIENKKNNQKGGFDENNNIDLMNENPHILYDENLNLNSLLDEEDKNKYINIPKLTSHKILNNDLNIVNNINNLNSIKEKSEEKIKLKENINIDIEFKNFIFYFNDNNNDINYQLSIFNLIKHIINPKCNTENQDIINKFIGKFDYNIENNLIIFNLKSYNDSLFMRNIELLIEINSFFSSLEKENYNIKKFNICQNVDENFIQLNLKRITYEFLIKTLELIHILSKKLYNNKSNEATKIKTLLLNYTIGTVFRISSHADSNFKKYDLILEKIRNKKEEVNELREKLSNKIDKLNNIMEKQTQVIQKYYNKIK